MKAPITSYFLFIVVVWDPISVPLDPQQQVLLGEEGGVVVDEDSSIFGDLNFRKVLFPIPMSTGVEMVGRRALISHKWITFQIHYIHICYLRGRVLNKTHGFILMLRIGLNQSLFFNETTHPAITLHTTIQNRQWCFPTLYLNQIITYKAGN